MTDLFFPGDRKGKDFFIATISHEIAAASGFVTNLKDRAEEVTDTDLDLSCLEPYDVYGVAQAIFSLHDKTGIDLPFDLGEDETTGVAKIGTLPAHRIKEYFMAITNGYRQAALNILLGIGGHYKNAEGLLPDIGPSRDTPHRLVEEVMEHKIDVILNPDAVVRSSFESDMQEIRLSTREAWSQMFDGKSDKKLPDDFFGGKIKEGNLREAFSKMKDPKFSF